MSVADTAPTLLWFLNTLVRVHAPVAGPGLDMQVLEHRAPFRDSPPLHVHTTEDELFVVLEGQLRVRVGGADVEAGPGRVLVAPKQVPHTYLVESTGGARWLTVTTRGDFAGFVRATSRPADAPELPVPGGPPTAEEVAALASSARRFGIDLVGPPLG